MDSCRSLIIVQVPPHPPTGGVALRNWQTLNLLKHHGDVAVFSIHKGAACQSLQQQGVSVSHYDMATPKRSWPEKIKNRLGELRHDGYYYSDWLYTAAAAKELRHLVKTFQPTLVVFEELWLYPYLKTIQRATNCATVLDNHNIEGDKEDYRLKSRALDQIRHIEQKFVRQVNQTWVCSDRDRQKLQQLYGVDGRTVHVIPNGVDADFYQPQQPAERRLHQVLFLGKFSYQPNAEAALILIHEIYPQLKQRFPDTQLWLVGRDPTPAMETAAMANAHIHVTGLVPDVRPYLHQASTLVVPLYQGGGTRLKILEAFASHCPVVSTPKGAEGLTVKDTHHLYLGNSTEDLVAQVTHLWENDSIRHQTANHAYDLFLSTYAWNAVLEPLSVALNTLSHD